MKYAKPQRQKIEDFKNQMDVHGNKINDLESINKFFIIVVSATLVATLVGLGGLYISAFKDKESALKNSDELTRELIKQVVENKLSLELIEARNPYLK